MGRNTAQNGQKDKSTPIKHNRSTPTKDEKRGHSRAWHLTRNAKKNTTFQQCSRHTELRTDCSTHAYADGRVSVMSAVRNHTNASYREPVQSACLLSETTQMRHTVSRCGRSKCLREALSVFDSKVICGILRHMCKNKKQETVNTVKFWPRK